MTKPTLVIMAAGMGSRYGGLKQIDPIDAQGHLIIDFSLYDAYQAGFRDVVFIIKEEIEADFKEIIGDRIAKLMTVTYVYQRMDTLPAGFSVPEGRAKPFGTGQAIYCCRGAIEGPFAVINADDYYGADAFHVIYDYLSTVQDDVQYRYAMVGYQLDKTLTEHGHVARGVCTVDENNYLSAINERVRIEKQGDGASYTEDDGETWHALAMDSTVSMNLWGFTNSILDELDTRFATDLTRLLQENPLKGEFFLPGVVDALIQEKKATATVLKSSDRWYGVTYKEDKPVVMQAIADMKAAGKYPDHLWK